MPSIFSRRKKDGKSKKDGLDDADLVLQKPKWDDAWTRKTVEPEEVRELLHGCTEELKSRGRASIMRCLAVVQFAFIPTLLVN
jgi:hypothetical protein